MRALGTASIKVVVAVRIKGKFGGVNVYFDLLASSFCLLKYIYIFFFYLHTLSPRNSDTESGSGEALNSDVIGGVGNESGIGGENVDQIVSISPCGPGVVRRGGIDICGGNEEIRVSVDRGQADGEVAREGQHEKVISISVRIFLTDLGLSVD